MRIQIPRFADVEVLEANKIKKQVPFIRSALVDALNNAVLDCKNHLSEYRKIETVAIAISHEICPQSLVEILPCLLEWLYTRVSNLIPEGITMIVGGGLFSSADQQKVEMLVSQNKVHGCKILFHSPFKSPVVYYGRTDNGAPIYINTAFASADYKIVLGQVIPHHFVGFTGGAKEVVIGCGGEATIKHIHTLLYNTEARVGVLDGNPVQEVLNQAGELICIDLAINFVKGPNQELVKVFAGQPVDTLIEGAKICKDLYGVCVDEKFDIVVVSCSEYPKEISLKKGLYLASQTVKNGGNILLLTASVTHLGTDIFFDYVFYNTNPRKLLAYFRRQRLRMSFDIDSFYDTVLSSDGSVFSEFGLDALQGCHLRAADSSKVIAEWTKHLEGRSSIGVIPNVKNTYFYKLEPYPFDNFEQIDSNDKISQFCFNGPIPRKSERTVFVKGAKT